MIVGFGESGQEAMRFLLEYGSFIGKDLNAAPSTITVYDENLEKNRGHFLHLAPALKDDARLRWHTEPAGTEAFWEQYDKLLDQGLRYMVVAMDKGTRNVSLAIKRRAGNPHLRTHGNHLETGRHQRAQPQADGHPLLGGLPAGQRER